MEREPVRGRDGSIEIRLSPYARKDSGSFYTPQELVELIVDQTLKPLVEERLEDIRDQGSGAWRRSAGRWRSAEPTCWRGWTRPRRCWS